MNKTIDKPANGTGEWAAHNVNIHVRGCEHRCAYCYAQAMAIRFGRATPESWEVPVIDATKVAKRYGRKKGRIMFPTAHDCTPANLDACLVVLKKILASGNEVLVVSKPHLECVRLLCTELAPFKAQILFRFTIGSADDAVLKAWEPGAPSFSERLECLKHAFYAGFETSVSCEPMLDGRIDKVIAKAKPYVTDAIWLDRANRLRQIVSVNRPDDAKAKALANSLISVMTDDYVRELYARYCNDPAIKFKDSIKKVVGLERPTVKGLDV